MEIVNDIFEWIQSAASNVSAAMYSYILIIILIAGGLYFSVRTKFVQFRCFGDQIKAVMEKPGKGGGVSSFQALMVSTASRVGTGNIVGVSTALCIGGFGSVFWMWIIALVGAASAFVESTLAQIYKKKGEDGSYGGPAYYIEAALKCRPLAAVFSVLLIITYGVGFNMLASYNLQSTFSSYSFYNESYTPWIIGAVCAALVCFCLFGGGKRIVAATSFMVPIMGTAYILVAFFIVIVNINTLPEVFARIFSEAFDLRAIFGGFGGSCVMYGIKRGLFSNEAGVGSAPNASASAEVAHPAKQGLVQVLSVFIDTILVCSATAFMCMCSGVEATKELSGAPYVQAALESTLGAFGPVFITVSMILFAFTTLLGNLFYVDKSIRHLSKKKPSRAFMYCYYIVASLVIFIGAGLDAGFLWDVADITMGLMTLVNIPVIIILGKYAFRALDDYLAKKKKKDDSPFCARDIGIEDGSNYWN